MRILFLLAGVSYYKTTAAPVIDLGDHPTTAARARLPRRYYVHGLGEFAYRNGIDLRGLEVDGPGRRARPRPSPTSPSRAGPLIPFGGGIDSIVTVESLAPGPPRRGAVRRPPARRPLRRHRGRRGA